MANGRVGHGGPAKTPYGEPYKIGDVITVQLTKESEYSVALSFYRNFKPFGKAFDLPMGVYNVAVSLYAAGDAIVALKTGSTLTSADVKPRIIRSRNVAEPTPETVSVDTTLPVRGAWRKARSFLKYVLLTFWFWFVLLSTWVTLQGLAVTVWQPNRPLQHRASLRCRRPRKHPD